ncbi:MAG: DUF433 domain-containing protein [Burkholderiales bacterium]|nr:MAG: DUF433 domain-containing protein [Burkholderiales bacterium]
MARQAQLAARIVVDPEKLGGEAHLRGTKITVAEIRAAWREKGVYVSNILKRFHELQPDDVEAALFHWSDPAAPAQAERQAYTAEWAGPPRRKLYLEMLYSAPNEARSECWRLAACEFDDDGLELFISDVIEDAFSKIIDGYPERYAPRGIVWRDAASHEIVDIYNLKAE